MEAEIHHIKNVPVAPEYAVRKEVLEAIQSLSESDHIKLLLAAKFWVRYFNLHGSELKPEDLLQEAIYRVSRIAKPRRWPKHITFLVFLKNVMKSIASHEVEQLVGDECGVSASLGKEEKEVLLEPGLGQDFCVSEARLRAVQELNRLQSFFGTDTIAFKAMVMNAKGFETWEILEELNVDKKEWETIRKRIQRKLTKYLQENAEES